VSAVSEPFAEPLNIALAPVRLPDSLHSRSAIPFALFAVWFSGCAMACMRSWRRWRSISKVVQSAVRTDEGREADALALAAATAGLRRPIALAVSDSSLEPGIYGVLSPVLVWPRAIGQHLTGAELDAIVAHEMVHVRRHDNLVAAVHMLVEVLFWFHPLVWWIGAQLIDERERACDEAVTAAGVERRAYAEGILKTCKFSIASPVACVSGVTGSDLKGRIERIVRPSPVEALTVTKVLVIAALGTTVTALPLIVGLGLPQRLLAQAAVAQDGPGFEAATIRPNNSGARGSRGNNGAGGRYLLTNVPAFSLIQEAYGVRDIQIIDAPGWVRTDRYDISAIGPDKPNVDQRRSLWRKLLTDRFAIKIHHETRTLPAANLVLARADGKLGPHLLRGTDADADCKAALTVQPDFSKGPPPCSQMFSIGQFRARGLTMERLAQVLTNGMSGFSFVFDETHLDGIFNIDLFEYRPEGLAPTPPADWNGVKWPSPDTPGIFTALEEQLGLKLEPIKGPMDVIVIDHIERPLSD
jgi:uncharacterized protein (TIGR03435 family)